MRHRSSATREPEAKSTPTRACVVCRAEKGTAELVRLSWHKGVVGLGRGDKGRGAHVCATRACLTQLSSHALTRAFKAATEIEVEVFLAQLHGVAQAKVLEAVGLARRQGALAYGVDELSHAPAASQGGLVLLAADLSERALRHAPEGSVFIDGAALGHAAGMGYLGAVRLAPGRLSDQAAYWISVWYESQSPGLGTRPGGGSAGEGRLAANATPVQL
jgi:predicted RNA-binding protein YlxR (DUF448 family)